MRKKIKELYEHSTLVAKIRYSYLCLLVPFVLFLIFCFYNLWNNNRRYEDMINSSVMASQFSLDFQKDFDYETYLLIVGNKTLEESSLHDMLVEADDIVAGLEELTESQENLKRLTSVKKYLNNLETYIGRIEDNIREGNRYEDNMEIWENDVQIVTSLVGDTMSQYIYYEVRGIQQSRAAYQTFFMKLVRFSLLGMGLLLLLVIILSYYIPRSITMPITRISRVTNQVAKGNLSVRAAAESGAEARMLSDSLNAMIDKINELLDQVTTEQIRLRKAEFELLQAQINPHFLYNTLDSIRSEALKNDQTVIAEMVERLSKFFRYCISNHDSLVSLAEELRHVDDYFYIQRFRFGERFSLQTVLEEPGIRDYYVPRMILQPIIENSIFHGLELKPEHGEITIEAGKTEQKLYILISDNGAGMPRKKLDELNEQLRTGKLPDNTRRHGIAVLNVNNRIKLCFGEEYGMRMHSVEGCGCQTEIVMPLVDSFCVGRYAMRD